MTKEAVLKAGKADRLIIDKIVADFSPEELADIPAQYVENTRFRHSFGDIGPEAWKTLSLQSYFPDLKIPETVLNRTQAAIQRAIAKGTTEDELTSILQKSVKEARKKRLAPAQ